MILTPHIIVGATIGAKSHNLGLIIILGILSHFILDKIPHWDYINSGIRDFKKTKDFKALFFDLLKIALDGLIGLSIAFLIIWQRGKLSLGYLPFILAGIFFATLPDIGLGLSWFFGGRLAKKYINFHEFFHFKHKEKEGKITFLGLSTEIIITIIAIIILLL